MNVLMIWLRQQFTGLDNPIATLFFWIAIEALVYMTFTWLIPLLTRNTKTEIDDIVIDILRIPLITIIGAYAILDWIDLMGRFFPSHL